MTRSAAVRWVVVSDVPSPRASQADGPRGEPLVCQADVSVVFLLASEAGALVVLGEGALWAIIPDGVGDRISPWEVTGPETSGNAVPATARRNITLTRRDSSLRNIAADSPPSIVPGFARSWRVEKIGWKMIIRLRRRLRSGWAARRHIEAFQRASLGASKIVG
jgi:hypothetical protein